MTEKMSETCGHPKTDGKTAKHTMTKKNDEAYNDPKNGPKR